MELYFLGNPQMRYFFLLLSLFVLKVQTQVYAFSGDPSVSAGSNSKVACATVNVPLTATYCNGDIIPATIFTSVPAGATFNWTNSNVAIGLPASGTGNMAAFPAVNLSANTPITAVITVTPIIGACTGIPSIYSITIDPTPTASLAPLTQTEYCFGDTVKMTVTLTGKLPLAFFMNSNARLYASATYTRVITETAVGAHTFFFSPIDYVYDNKGCGNYSVLGGPDNFIIRALPTATVSGTDSACFGATKNIKIVLTGSPPWLITYDSAGLAPVTIKRYTSPVFIPVSAIGTWTYKVSAVTDSFCSNNAVSSATIKIKPIPSIVQPANQTYCAGTSTAAFPFTSIPAGGTFSWTNSNTLIGLAASGTGPIPSFIPTNGGTSPIAGNIAVSPVVAGCAGSAVNYSITVNPLPVVTNTVSTQICPGTVNSATAFISIPAGASFSWTNNNTAIGLAASGTGNVPAFTATNPSAANINGTISVVPTFGGCAGNSSNYIITINATPVAIVPPNLTVCEGGIFTATNFTSTPVGASFTWTNSDASIGLAAFGSGGLPGYAAANPGTTNLVANLSVIPTLNTCVGNASTYTITVKPLPTFTPLPSNQIVCVGSVVPATIFTSLPAGSTYAWTNSNTSIGIAASGTNSIPSYTAINPGSNPVTSTLTVIAANAGCSTTPFLFTITVNPFPSVTVPANQNVCNLTQINATSFTSSPVGATYTWTNSNTAIGLAASGTGDVPTFMATNSTTGAISGTIVVTPSLNGCLGTSSSYTITLKPNPLAVVPSNQTVCAGSTIAASAYTSIPAGASFGWANSDPSIGLAFSGSNNTPAFTALNSTGAPVTATIEVAAILNGCMGPNVPYTITIKPEPLVTVPSNQVICDGASTVPASFSSLPAGATYAWTNSNTSIGLAASGNGTVPSFVATNSGSAAISGNISVVPTVNGCTGNAASFSITVNPTPSANVPSNQSICDGASLAATSFTSIPSGATYTWTNSTTTIGLAANGSGNVPSFIGSNAGSTAVSASIAVTPTLNGCIGNAATYTIIVNPAPNVTVPTNLSICDATLLPASNFTSVPAGATYSWTNSNVSIGLVASGTGNVPSFTTTNSGSAAISGIITVIPTANGCVGASNSYTITVNPKPSAVLPSSITQCPGSIVAASNYTSIPSGATFTWTNSNTAIGLAAASGIGNVPSFTLVNSGNATISSTLSVTPTIGGCIGNAASYTISVDPTPSVNVPSNQLVCAGASVSATNFTSATSGVSYTWTSSNTAIGIGASGSGNVPAFTALNSGTSQLVSTITVNPSATCTGISSSYTITVNPLPTVTTTDESVCDGDNVLPINWTSVPAGASFSWSNSNTSIGLGANGTAGIPSFVATNSGSSSLLAIITVIPSLSGCAGSSNSFTITVKPRPQANVPSNQSVCDGTVVSATSFSSVPTGATYTWSNSNSTSGLPLSGNGNVPSFTASNSGTSVINSIVSVVPTLDGCIGNAVNYQISVQPIPSFSLPANQSVCNGTLIPSSALTSVPAGASYVWTNSSSSIGLAASGTGPLPSFTATNTGTAPVTGTISITPSLNGCPGIAQSFTVTVNPQPIVSVPTNQAVCDGASIPASTFSSTPSGASYTWTNSHTAIGLGSSGSGNVPSFVGTNTGNTVLTGTITVTPAIGGCIGNPELYTLTINPKPIFTVPTNQVVCSGATVPLSNLVSQPAGATFNWSNSNNAIGLLASGIGSIPSFTASNNGAADISALLTITPSLNGCVGNSNSYSLLVHPLPILAAPTSQVFCPGDAVSATTLTSTPLGASFNWTNSTSAIGLGVSGIGNIPAFTSSNSTSSAITSTLTITPTLNTCAGLAVNYTITVNPKPSNVLPASQTLCNGALVPSIALSSVPSGASFTWTNNNTNIGLLASGTNTIPSFTANNSSTGIITGSVSIIPTLNGCIGNSGAFSYTVNPVATVSVPGNIQVCEGLQVSPANFSSVPAGATYSWTNSTTAIGLTATGTGNLPSFTGTNGGLNPLTSTITVTPTLSTCAGTAATFTITINPTPTISAISNQSVCAGITVPASNFSSNQATATYVWTNTNTAIGLAGSGNGNTPAFTSINSSNSTITGTLAVTASLNGCSSAISNFTVAVKPIPQIQSINNQNLCAGVSSSPVSFTSATAGTSFSWSNTSTGTGLAASGAGNIASFWSTNSTVAPLVSTITVTPSYQSCVGANTSFNITVNPIPVQTQPSSQNICEGTAVLPTLFTSNVAGTTYTWINSTTSIGLAASGSGDIPSFAIQNPTSLVLTATVTVTPLANGCTGSSVNFTISAVPAPKVVGVSNKSACVGSTIPTINFTSIPPGSSYNWTNSITDIGLATSGSGSINSFTAGNSNPFADVALITVSPTLNGCLGNDTNFTITVQPQATVAVPLDTIVCAGTSFTSTAFSGTPVSASFSWTNSLPAIGLSSSGNNTLPAFTTRNSTGAPLTALITVTPSEQGCIGISSSFTIQVNSLPLVDFSYSPEEATIFYPHVQFADNSSYGASYFWDFGDGDSSTSKNAVHDYQDTGCYTVYFIVTTNEGCFDSMSRELCIKDEYHVYIPDAFTPNGDGLNDVFFPVGRGLITNDYEMTIYNRKSTLIFTSTEIEKGWAGYSNGLMIDEKTPMDTYVYKIRVKDHDGKYHFFTGQVKLIR